METSRDPEQFASAGETTSFPQPTVVHWRYAYLTMGLGILLAISGVAGYNAVRDWFGASIPLVPAALLIFGQYLGLSRGSRGLLLWVNVFLALLSIVFFLLVFAFAPVLLLLLSTIPTLLWNIDYRAELLKAERAGIPPRSFAKVTLAEIFGIFVILALILGPAAWLGPRLFTGWD